jgi:hypothetical protein
VRRRRFTFAPLFLPLAPLLTLATACSSAAPPVGQGGQCEVATDCENGLICEPQKNGTSICSNNLTGVQQLPPSADAGGAAPAPTPDAAAVSDSGPTIPTSVPEASAGD